MMEQVFKLESRESGKEAHAALLLCFIWIANGNRGRTRVGLNFTNAVPSSAPMIMREKCKHMAGSKSRMSDAPPYGVLLLQISDLIWKSCNLYIRRFGKQNYV